MTCESFIDLCYDYTTFTNFSMKYLYTDVGGINSYTMFVNLYVR